MVGKSHSGYWNDWEVNAQIDPMYAILSSADHDQRKWNPKEFFATGDAEIDFIFHHLETLNLAPPRTKFLDFGCGVGRLSRALAKRFPAGVGVDISPSMIEMAIDFNKSDATKIAYIVNKKNDLFQLETATIGFVYCHIVLQHMPNDLQKVFIGEFCRVLEPAGVAVFQIPTQRVRNSKDKSRLSKLATIKALVPTSLKEGMKRLVRVVDRPRVTMEMNVLAEPIIDAIISRANCQIIQKVYSNSTEPNHNGRIEFFDRKEAWRRIACGHAISPDLSTFYFVKKIAARSGASTPY